MKPVKGDIVRLTDSNGVLYQYIVVHSMPNMLVLKEAQDAQDTLP